MSTNQHEHQEVRKAILSGAIAGATATAIMVAGEKLEQSLTGRPNSVVPAHSLERLIGLRELPDSERATRNFAMQLATGIVTGTVRGLMARSGTRGFKGWTTLLGFRLAFDQLLENATGVGAPPKEWPLDERWIDKTHKAVFAAFTGLLADAMIEPVRRENYPEIWNHVEEQSPFMAAKVRKKRTDLAVRRMLDS
jgi:hypothetical protein